MQSEHNQGTSVAVQWRSARNNHNKNETKKKKKKAKQPLLCVVKPTVLASRKTATRARQRKKWGA